MLRKSKIIEMVLTSIFLIGKKIFFFHFLFFPHFHSLMVMEILQFANEKWTPKSLLNTV